MEMEEMGYLDEDEVVFTLKMDGNEILDLEQTFPYEQEQVKANAAEDVWDTDSTEFLLLSYYQSIHSFRASEEEAERQWINISGRLSRTTESCQRQFERLQNKYFELARSQLHADSNVLNALDIDWPYFDLFFKMCQYTQPAKVKLYDVDKINMDLLQYYIKHKHLFMAAEFGGEMRLWSMFSKELEPEESAYKIRFLRWNYLTLKAKVTEINSPNIEKMYSRRQEYRMWSAAFDPPAPVETVSRETLETRMRKHVESKSQNKRKAKWRNEEIMSLIVFYSENRNLFKSSTSTRDLWKPLTDRVDRTTSDCQRKFNELMKKYEHFNEKLLQKPNAKIPWRYYTILDNLFTESDVSENTTSIVKNETDVSQDDYSTDNVGLLEENDDDTVCIIVAPEEDEQLYTILSTVTEPNTTTEENMPHSYLIEDASLRWVKKARIKLLNLYKEYIEQHRNQEIKEVEMWTSIGAQMRRSPVQCRRRFNMMKVKYFKMLKLHNRGEEVDWPFFSTFGNVFRLKPIIQKDPKGMAELERILALQEPIKTEPMNADKVSKMLNYYLSNVEEFVSPKYKKNKVWAEMGKAVGMGSQECKRIFAELQHDHKSLIKRGEAHSAHFEMFEKIWEKERQILEQVGNDPTVAYFEEAIETFGFDIWDDSETLKLLEWYHRNSHRFKNRKYIHKYIWRETETALGLNPARCSKKMRDIRATYRAKLLEMQKQDTECQWEYFDICKRIYGTDLDDPFLSKTKKPKRKQLKEMRPFKKFRRNKKVMSKETVERLVNYYLENYYLFQNPPTGVARHVWQDLSSDIGFSNLACQKKLELLKRQYENFLTSGDNEGLERWPYTGLMRRVVEYSMKKFSLSEVKD